MGRAWQKEVDDSIEKKKYSNYHDVLNKDAKDGCDSEMRYLKEKSKQSRHNREEDLEDEFYASSHGKERLSKNYQMQKNSLEQINDLETQNA